MKFNIPLTSLILFFAISANANSADCQKKLENKRIEMSVIASNIANLNTTRTPEGGPYQRQKLVCSNDICEIVKEQTFLSKLEPGHPDADENGYVTYPNIEIRDEMSNMDKVTRDYEEIIKACK